MNKEEIARSGEGVIKKPMEFDIEETGNTRYKIDKNGKQSEVLVNWEEISDYIKKIFDDC